MCSCIKGPMVQNDHSKQWIVYGIIFVVMCIPVKSVVFLNQWAVHVDGGLSSAEDVAAKHGFTCRGQIGSLLDYYLFEHHDVSRRSVEQSTHNTLLHSDPRVNWAEQQKVHRRVKRDFVSAEQFHQRFKRDLGDKYKRDSSDNNIPKPTAQNQSKMPANAPKFNDEVWPDQWYLHGGAVGGFDMNIIPAWQKGYTGKGVVVTILDDGIERNHTDLALNYDPQASWDINGNDNDPSPRYDNSDTNRHGTRCAGEVAAVANNTKCIVGAAFNAKVGGVRMLDGDVSDYVEAQSLSLNPQHIDIYSASWGPDDNGKVVDGPAKLAKEAFIQGVLKGRGGRGSIFVWASGNGGSQSDSCNCDGYTNSIFTLSISSAAEKGTKPWYLEECSSTLATTYSSGQNYGEKKIVTTDLHDKCSDAHTGTSASAPLAAGICALALEANPGLTWRDMQYVVMMTARPEPLVDGEWIVNAVGRKVSHKYGYGMMDASALVDLAERWQTVPVQHICTSKVLILDKLIQGDGVEVSMDVDGCKGQVNNVMYMEHVQAKVTLSYSRRGDIKLNLISPSGTKSTLLPKRKNDYLEGQFKDWPFMSVHFWGERPPGTWKLQVENTGSLLNRGKLLKWQLILYGVAEEPVRLKQPKEPKKLEPVKVEPPSSTLPTTVSPVSTTVAKTEATTPSPKVVVTAGKKTEENANDKKENESAPKQVQCNDECSQGCSGPRPEDCTACKHVRLSNPGPCVRNCPKRQFENKAGGTCEACTAPCDSCSTSATQCTSCAEKHFLYEHTCPDTCPKGFYPDNDSRRCLSCPKACTSCSSVGNCLTCNDGYQNINGDCAINCPVGYFSESKETCSKCAEGCFFCKGAAKSDCIRCRKEQFHDENGNCLDACPAGTFAVKLTEVVAMCATCDSECRTCDGPELDDCTSCYGGFTLARGFCLPHCGPGTYRDLGGGCSPCSLECFSCSGPSSDECTDCVPPRFLLDGECSFGCPRGFYMYRTRGSDIVQCYECDASCSQCVGAAATDCYSCRTNYSLHDGRCVRTCPPPYYTSEGVCTPCHYSCLTCSGEGETSCRSCRAGYILTAGSCIQQLNSEEPHCPRGRYLETDTNRCELCDTSCSTCQGSGSNNCLSCDAPLRFFQSHHRCVLCCSHSNTIGCCNCHPLTGVCMENRNINNENTDFQWPEVINYQRTNSLSENARSTWHQKETVYSGYVSPRAFSKRGLFAFAVLVCICSVVLFLVVFMLLQARSSERLCWGHRYEAIPAFYDISRERVSLTRPDEFVDVDGDEEDVFTA